MIGTPLLVFLLMAAEDKPAPKFPIGKETTYVTGPLDKEGYIDYETALNERLGKGITPERNANALLWKAFGAARDDRGREMPAEFFKQLGIEQPPKEGPYYTGIGTYLRENFKLDFKRDRRVFDLFFDQQDRAQQRPWTAKDYPDIAAWLKANEQPLAVVLKATKRPDYFDPLVFRRTDKGSGSLIADLPSPQKCREVARALTARAMLRVGEGNFDEAWQDLLACHRLGRLVARGASLIDGLAGIGIDQTASNADLQYLERAELTRKQIQHRLKDLQRLPPIPPMADKIDVAERFVYLDALQLIRRGGFSMVLAGLGVNAEKPEPQELKALEKIDWEPPLRNGNRWYDRLAAALRLKDRADRDKALDKIEQELKALKEESAWPHDLADKMASKAIGDVLIGMLIHLPATHRIQNAYDRVEQAHRNLRVAFALAAYRRDYGRHPAKLKELAPKYLPAVPNDLFSGNSLVYRPSEKGYLFYSVGVNGKDEGGHSFGDDPAGDDLCVRMPRPPLKQKK